MPLPVPFAFTVTVEPLTATAPVVLPAVKVAPAPEDSVVLPFEASVVNAPVEAVVAPIAVPLIPVAVVLKLPEVIRILLVPASIDEAPSPASERVPEVAVKFSAPVVSVNPFDAVSSPFDVIVPPPVVEMLPLVVRTPFSLMVKVGVPPLDWIARAVLVPALVSLMTSALPVPALVKAKPVALPLLVKVKDVGVVKPELSVKAMFRPSVVVIVLPVL